MTDDVDEETKTRRVSEIMDLQRRISEEKNLGHVGQSLEVLVEGESKKSTEEWQGRTDGNKTVIFPKGDVAVGEYARVRVHRSNSATLFGRLIPERVGLTATEAA